MNKNYIASFFSVLFMAMLAAPSIIVVMDDSVDTSVFYSLSEEEKKEGKENNNIEVFLSSYNSFEGNILTSDSQLNLRYYFNNYSKPHLNLISPPPDFKL